MKKNIVISIDSMGGENAPESIIAGISDYCQNYALEDMGLRFLLCGPQDILVRLVEQYRIPQSIIEIIDSDEFIMDNEDPMESFRAKKRSSMRMAIDFVHKGFADGCISGGNTGALMLTSKLVLGTMEFIHRPAIISPFPNELGYSAILDLGANTEINEDIMFQFAIMGEAYYRVLFNKENPSIGILNVGVEEIKGRQLEKKAHAMLKESKMNYIGFIEPHQIINGETDVIVTDGFSGNILLKSAEGVAKLISSILKQTLSNGVIGKICSFLLKSKIKEALSFMNPAKSNGALLVGVNGIIIKSHGSSNAEGFANAISIAYKLIKNDVNEKIKNRILDRTNSH